MYASDDTIVAAGTPTNGIRTILRVTGPRAGAVCGAMFGCLPEQRAIVPATFEVRPHLVMEALVYVFPAGRSYTGQMLVEVHCDAPGPLVQWLTDRLVEAGARPAGPGEFTARAYLNNKLDLAQAEAVHEVITASNLLQLEASQRLLQGRLGACLDEIKTALVNLLGLIESDLDFSDQDIQGLDRIEVLRSLDSIRGRVRDLQSEGIQVDALAHLPCVGIAGAPNAGKSSLFNALLHRDRSIVSELRKTTRDVLASPMDLRRSRLVLFDCAGLVPCPEDPIDLLSQEAACSALHKARLVLFCADLTKQDLAEDQVIYQRIDNRRVLVLGTKADALAAGSVDQALDRISQVLDRRPYPVSARMGSNLEGLRDMIDQELARAPGSDQALTVLCARHSHALAEAADLLDQARTEVLQGRDEIGALLIRSAHHCLAEVDHHLDDRVLDRIFSRFCIGK